MSGELSPASVYVSLLPVVEACVVVAVPGRVGEVRVAADEPEAVDLPPRTKRARAATRGLTVLAVRAKQMKEAFDTSCGRQRRMPEERRLTSKPEQDYYKT